MDEIIRIAKASGAEAMHPGYGLLSENADFAKKCMEEGLRIYWSFTGVIGSMGSKIEARKTMKEAGVPIIEGIDTSLNNEEEAIDCRT